MMVYRGIKCIFLVEYAVAFWGQNFEKRKLCHIATWRSASTLSLVFGRQQLLISTQILAILADILRWFSDLPQENARLLPELGSDIFLQNSFVFITSRSLDNRSCTNWDNDSVVKHATKEALLLVTEICNYLEHKNCVLERRVYSIYFFVISCFLKSATHTVAASPCKIFCHVLSNLTYQLFISSYDSAASM
jgi:hypothetical protein